MTTINDLRLRLGRHGDTSSTPLFYLRMATTTGNVIEGIKHKLMALCLQIHDWAWSGVCVSQGCYCNKNNANFLLFKNKKNLETVLD